MTPGPIVVGGFEDAAVFFQVDPDQHLPAGAEDARAVRQKAPDRLGLEIADRRAREEADPLAAGPGKAGSANGPRIIGADRDDRQFREVLGERGGGFAQMLARDVDRHVGGRPVERLQQDAHLVGWRRCRIR